MKLLLLVLCELFIAIFGIIQDQKSLETTPDLCITPNNDVGICVEVHKCSILIDAIRSQKVESYSFLRESRCGTPDQVEQYPKVCCGMYDNYVDQVTTVRTGKRLIVPKKDLFSTPCGKYSAFDVLDCRIFGGMEASLGQFPWMGRLRHRRSDGLLTYGCAGFLISEKFVLTAAHCIESKALEAFGPVYQVQLGEHNTESDPDCTEKPPECADSPQYLRTAEPVVHPDYSNDNQYHHDIAVIPLQEPAKLTDYVSPICLLKTPSKNSQMWLSGWGKTKKRASSPIKLKVMVPRTDWTQCSTLYKSRGMTILKSQLCAGGEEGKDSCTGDSGGPLMVPINTTWFAEGIVSFGMACGQKDWPAVYTNLPHYMPWIELVVSQYLEEYEEDTQVEEETKTVVGNQVETRYIWSK